MLEISLTNAENWWTTPLKVDLPLETSLRNLGVLELHLVKEEIMWSSWNRGLDNRRKMGRDENRTLEMRNQLLCHLLNQPNLRTQTKIINRLHQLKTFLLNQKWILRSDDTQITSRRLIGPELNYPKKLHGLFFRRNWEQFNPLHPDLPLLLKTSQSYLDLASLLRRQEFHQPSWLRHLIYHRLLKISAMMNTYRRLITFDVPMPTTKLSSPLSTLCKANDLLIRSLDPYGERLYKIHTLTTKNYTHPWIVRTIIKTNQRNLLEASPWLERSISRAKNLLNPKAT